MTLQALFDDCLGVIFKESALSPSECEEMKHSLVRAWIKITGRRIDTLLTEQEKEKVHEVITHLEADKELAHAKLEELFMPVVTSLERYNEIMEIVFAEASRLIEQLFNVFSQHATDEQIFQVKETLKKYEKVLGVRG